MGGRVRVWSAAMPGPTTAEGPGGRERWALWLGTVAAYSDMYLTQPVLPLLSAEFGVGPARAALTVSAVVLAIAGAASSYGPLSDALGRRRVMAGATGLLSLATLGCAFAPTLNWLIALRALQGLLVPGMTAVAVAYAGDRFHAGALARVVAGVMGASVVGGLVGRVGAGAVAALAGWRPAFGVFALFTLAAAAGMWRELSPARPAARLGWAEAWRGMLAHLRDPRLVGAFLVGASMFFGWIGVFTYLPYHLSAAPYRLSTGLVSSVYLVYAAGAATSVVVGRLSGRVAPRTLIAVGLVIEAAGMLAALATPLPVVVAGLVVLVIGTFTAQSVAPAFVNVTARRAKGGASALYLTFYYSGGTLGSLLPGLAWQAWGWPGVLAACGAAVGVGFLANWLLCGR